MALKSSSTGTVSGASSLTISHTVPAGTGRVMVVMVSGLNSVDPLSAATVAYGGVSMGAPVVTAAEALPQVSGNNYVYAWTLANPAVGTANVVITCAGGGYLDAVVCTLDGVASATPAAKPARSIAFEASPAVLAVAGSGRQVVDFICNRANGKTMTPAAGQTRIGTAIAGGVSSSTGSYAENVTTMDWTHPDNGTANISRVAMAFESGGGGGGASTEGALTLAPATLSGSASVAGTPAAANGALTLAPATLSGSASVAGPGATVVGDVIADPDGAALTNTNIPKVCYLRLHDMTVAVNLTNQQTDATGMMSRTHAGLVAGVDYLRVLSDATGATTGCKVYRAT